MSPAASEFSRLTVAELAAHCAEETQRFFRKQFTQGESCFELFRRALALCDEQAWSHILAVYSALVVGWVQQHPLFAHCHEDARYFANGAFSRLWRSCTADKFARFDALPKVLAYLKACTHSEVVDFRRAQPNPDHEWDDERMAGIAVVPPQEAGLDQAVRAEFWRIVQSRLRDEQERLVIEYCFILEYKPRSLYALYDHLFADVETVYRLKENLARRLRRDPAMQGYFHDLAHD